MITTCDVAEKLCRDVKEETILVARDLCVTHVICQIFNHNKFSRCRQVRISRKLIVIENLIVTKVTNQPSRRCRVFSIPSCWQSLQNRFETTDASMRLSVSRKLRISTRHSMGNSANDSDSFLSAAVSVTANAAGDGFVRLEFPLVAVMTRSPPGKVPSIVCLFSVSVATE